MRTRGLDARGERVRAAWNSQDVERVLETYADEFRYSDPDTRGEIDDREGLRRYLTKLFGAVRTETTVRAAIELAEQDGVAVLWQAMVRRGAAKEEVEIDGIDLVFFEGESIARHEVFFDRAALAPLSAGVAS